VNSLFCSSESTVSYRLIIVMNPYRPRSMTTVHPCSTDRRPFNGAVPH
jgi:hypothetical protein